LLRSTGYSIDELIHEKWWNIFYPNGKNDPEIIKLNEISSFGHRSVRDHVMVLPAKNGEDRYISWTTANIFDEDGNPKELIGLGTDITSERLRANKKAEEEKMNALASMAGGLAHEISNALQPILGLSEICAIQVAGKDQKLEESMHIIKRNALHCRDIVNGVLSFSRRDVRETKVYNLRELLSEVIDFADEFLAVDIKVACKGFGDDPDITQTEELNIKVSRTEMVQIMANLFANASHAMQQCGIIEVVLDKITIDGNGTKQNDLKKGKYALISVKDTGCGMDEDIQQSLFEPFFTTKGVGEGTGLGLASVYGIMKSYGGAIQVQSKPGEGSTFSLYIPVVENDKEQANATQTTIKKGDVHEDGQHTRH